MSNLQNQNEDLFKDLAQIIEQGKRQLAIQVNSALTLTYWHIGKKINTHILHDKRAEYGKEIVPLIGTRLTERFGKGFASKNLNRMMQFAKEFPDVAIVVTLLEINKIMNS